jgi:hypothetical protein
VTAELTGESGFPEQILRDLFPGLPARTSGTRGWGSTPVDRRRFLALPDLDDVRMYLPASGSLGAGALRRARRSVDRRGQISTAVAARGLQLGLTRFLRSHVTAPVSADCVETQLARLLSRDVRMAIFLGPPRANRKPVLQIMGTDGVLLGVAKVGVNPLTSELASQEAAALRKMAQRHFEVVVPPALLGELTRQGHAMVVQSPLDVPDRPDVPPPALLRAVFNEISRSGVVACATLAGSPYLEQLRERVSMLPRDEMRAMSSAVLTELAAENAELEFGAWHGDLSPWNMAVDGEHVLVWDWERFAEGVPVGYDALHYAFLPRIKDPRSPQELAGVELLDRAGAVLEGVGVSQAQAPTVAMLYLVEVASRFAEDGQASTGILGGDVEQWLVPALRRYLTRERT